MNDEGRETGQRKAAIEDLHRRYSRSGAWEQRLRRTGRTSFLLLVLEPLAMAKRGLDLLVSLGLILGFSPLFLLGFLLTGRHLKRSARLGRWCRPFNRYSFDTERGPGGRVLAALHLASLPVLFNVFLGQMSFVGPRAISPETLSRAERAVQKRYNVRPGLISPWWIRQRANIAYGTELDTDLAYVEGHGLWGDLGISLKAIPAILYGGGVATAPDRVTLLGIPIANLTMAEALETMMASLDQKAPIQVCFVNADCANLAYKIPRYREILGKADLCLADGIGLKLAGKLLAQEIRQNVNGTDMFPRLCEALAGTGRGMFLLGARPGVPEGVARWVEENYPETRVSGVHHGYFSPEEEPALLARIRESGAALLLVAFGAPRQDIWIHEHLLETGVGLAMGVGGLFDFFSGRIPRAPLWMREIGMEWVYRFLQEPGRLWKRYLVGNTLFLYRVLVTRLGWGRAHETRNEKGPPR